MKRILWGAAWLAIGFTLVPDYAAQTLKENAALIRPPLPRGFRQEEGLILLRRLEELLSTRFNLLARATVDDAFRRAVKALPGEECTEDNCLALMQQYLEVRLIFTLGVLRSELTLLTLQLQEDPKKLVKNEICKEPCKTPQMLERLDILVQKLLVERDRDRAALSMDEPGIPVSPESLELTEGAGAGVFTVKLDSRPAFPVSIGVDILPMGMLSVEPQTLVFDAQNWNQPRELSVYAVNNAEMDGPRKAELVIKVTESRDMNYPFVSPRGLSLSIADDDNEGVLTLLSRPQGATVLVDGRVRLDVDGNPVRTPTELRLERGNRVVSVRLSGYREVRFREKVTRTRLGVRSVTLAPLNTSLLISVPRQYAKGRVLVDGIQRFGMGGKTTVRLEFPPGVYELRVSTAGADSERMTVTLKPGERRELRFTSFTLRRNFWVRTIKRLGLQNPYIGPEVESVLVKSGAFPFDRVGWTLPGLAMGVRGSGQSLEFHAANGSGSTPVFSAKSGDNFYPVTQVDVQRLALSYGYRIFRSIETRAGVSQTRLNFSSEKGDFQNDYSAVHAGAGWDQAFAGWRFRMSARFNTQGQGHLNAGINYEF